MFSLSPGLAQRTLNNNNNNTNNNNLRYGTQCVIRCPTNRNPAQSLQENSITVFGSRLYNSLPKYLRDIESVIIKKFKFALDKFLEFIPDQPKMPNYVTASGSNSILDKLTHLTAHGIYQSGGVPDSPWSSLSCFEATPRIQVSRINLLLLAFIITVYMQQSCEPRVARLGSNNLC